MTFSTDVDAWVKATKLRGSLVMRKLAFDAYSGVLKRSPVDEGRFRGNWRIGVEQADLSSTNPPSSAKPKSLPKASETLYALKVLAGAQWESTILITNSLPYAKPLEDGHSPQAKAGIVGPTLEELRIILSRLNPASLSVSGSTDAPSVGGAE